MSWRDIPSWIQGAVIGSCLWIVFLLIRYAEYFYSRALIEDLGSKVQPYLYFSLPSALTLLGALILLSGGGALLGFVYQLVRQRHFPV